jgi:DNA polymerase-3 subunit gamma/tau
MEAARAAARGGSVPGGGLAAARAAAAGGGAGGGGAAGAGRAGAGRAGGGAGAAKAGGAAWSDGTPTEEAPYDPEFDGPPSAAAASIEGFDPGDEPLDDVLDEKTARQSGEELAMQLLRDAFGAEKIGEL